MKNIMIDIETLGTSANSVILSIGAVAFDENGLTNEFYTNVNIDSCLEAGLKIEGRTLRWWMEQSDAARKVFSLEGSSLRDALVMLRDAFDWSDTLVWANGTNFDLPILDTAYAACGLRSPWVYNNVRDYRTLRYQLDNDEFNALRVRPTVAHDALADAKAQALTLIAMQSGQKPLVYAKAA